MQQEIVVKEPTEIILTKDPEQVLKDASKAAKALAKVVKTRKEKLIINGKQYLYFEDWQTLGRFYGITARIVETRLVDLGQIKGFEAIAEAIHVPTGQVISRAEAMCLNDEKNWEGKPLFTLRSMAQTRACAKALRNVLAWVVVLAGYEPTPAEEAEIIEGKSKEAPPKPEPPKTNGQATEAQLKAIAAMLTKLGMTDRDQRLLYISELLGIEPPITTMKELTKDQAASLIEGLQRQMKGAKND